MGVSQSNPVIGHPKRVAMNIGARLAERKMLLGARSPQAQKGASYLPPFVILSTGRSGDHPICRIMYIMEHFLMITQKHSLWNAGAADTIKGPVGNRDETAATGKSRYIG